MGVRVPWFAALRAWLPPMPWARFEDGELLGWDTSWRMWKSFFLPWRSQEFLGVEPDGHTMILGPTRWNRPDAFRRPRRHEEPT